MIPFSSNVSLRSVSDWGSSLASGLAGLKGSSYTHKAAVKLECRQSVPYCPFRTSQFRDQLPLKSIQDSSGGFFLIFLRRTCWSIHHVFNLRQIRLNFSSALLSSSSALFSSSLIANSSYIKQRIRHHHNVVGRQ